MIAGKRLEELHADFYQYRRDCTCSSIFDDWLACTNLVEGCQLTMWGSRNAWVLAANLFLAVDNRLASWKNERNRPSFS